MARSSSGVIFSANAYMVSRQVQKLAGSEPSLCVNPARARWNAWLCRSIMPGSTIPRIASAAPALASVVTRAMLPDGSTSISTSRAQPCGSSTVSAR